VSVRFRLTIWNVNSSFTFATCMFLRPGFRLTIWNVNYFTDEQLQLLLECFILTKWYVNVTLVVL
ncbi:TPA: hypothetical protein P5Q15_004060, partial [Clostridioides difficile]|nr:hypothetical protein [Clostridioides difficile]